MRRLVLGIGGTQRSDSTTELALRISLRAAERAGARTVMLGGSDVLLPIYNPVDAVRSPQAQRFIGLVQECDGLIVASPGYHGSISGLVKNALDYIEDLRNDDRPYLEGRAVGCISCAQGWQAAGSTLGALRAIVHALRGWPTPMGASINTAGKVFDAGGNCIDAAVRAQLETVGAQVAEFARTFGPAARTRTATLAGAERVA